MSSQYEGIYFFAPGKWCAKLDVRGHEQHFGSYATEEQAGKACDWCVTAT